MTSTAQRLLEADLAGAAFRAGELSGNWRLAKPVAELQWPHVFTWVRAAARANSPGMWLVRWDAENYGSGPITGGFWDEATAGCLAPEKWPKGRPGSVVATVFKTSGWAAPGRGFYHPWDRLALPGHPWSDPKFAWSPRITIAEYVAQFHRWLNCEDYLGQ
jgi:hypothetical protein